MAVIITVFCPFTIVIFIRYPMVFEVLFFFSFAMFVFKLKSKLQTLFLAYFALSEKPLLIL